MCVTYYGVNNTFINIIHVHMSQEKIAKLKAKVESLEKERDDMKVLEAQMEAKVSKYHHYPSISQCHPW